MPNRTPRELSRDYLYRPELASIPAGQANGRTDSKEDVSMLRNATVFALAAGLVLGGGYFAGTKAGLGQDEKPPSGGEVKLESKKTEEAPIPNFARAYSLPFRSVSTLGLRLKQAREDCDPICLALIGSELGAYEKVSGKKAPLTADAVRKEAIDLGQMRRMSRELEVLADLVKDSTTATEIKSLADKAKQEEKDRAAAAKSGERERGFHYLKVQNNTDVYIGSIRVNGHHLGGVPAYSTVTFHTPFMRNHRQVFLSAHDNMGDVWRSHTVTGEHLTFHWSLNP
jgi:hypothetical protein